MNIQASEDTRAIADAAKVTELEAHVQYCLSGRVHDFRIEVHHHGLILKGRARTYYAKQLAQHAVMAATDRPILANVIDVC